MTKKAKSQNGGNPNRARSKNNPNGKRKDPKIDWSSYNKARRSEGENYVEWLGRIAEEAHNIMGIAPGTQDWRVSAILVSVVKSEEKLSYWSLVKHFDKHPEDLKRCELPRKCSRSMYQLRISEIDPAVLQKILVWSAGNEASHGTKITDSGGFSVSRYRDWYNAKYGDISVKLFAKVHIIHTLHGKICAAIVTPGEANDSPYLRKMIEMLPEGSGDVLADSAYGDKKNCQAIEDSGRRPIIDPKSNCVIKGFNARANMLRFREEHPRTFYNILRLRNNVESVISALKARFGGVVRALKDCTQSVELLSMCICYNMTFA